MKLFKKTFKLEVILKSGRGIIVKCGDWKIQQLEGNLLSYKFTDIKGAQPIYIRIEDISAIVKLN